NLRALVRIFDDPVAERIDHEDIVAGAADHRVVPWPPIQDVVARPSVQNVITGGASEEVVAIAAAEVVVTDVSDQNIVEAVAVHGLTVGAARVQILHVGWQQVAVDIRDDDVSALTGLLDHDVLQRIDDVDIIARAADQGVVAEAAVERVVAGA